MDKPSTTDMSKKPKTEKSQKQEDHVVANPTGGFSWQAFVEAHTFCAEQSFSKREGVTPEDIAQFAQTGDFVAQHYLRSLHSAVPTSFEQQRPFVPSGVEEMLVRHVRRLNEMLCELARAGRWVACEELWDQALKLSETFSELALKHPEPFKSKARQSLYMPSVRARNPKFTADAAAIAEAVDLSASTVGDKLSDNRKRIGALCARLVGECVHEITRSRNLWMRLYTPYKRTVVWPTDAQIKPLLGKEADDIIGNISAKDGPTIETHLEFFCLMKDCGSERLHFLLLPELAVETATDWWKGAIEGMVEAKFPALLQEPGWAKELKAVSRGTEADMRKELKDYCVGKVKQFAPRPARNRSAHRPPS